MQQLSSDSLMEDAITSDNDKIGEIMGATAALLIDDGDEHFTQRGSWPKLDDWGLNVSTTHDSINLSNSVDSIGHTEGAFEVSNGIYMTLDLFSHLCMHQAHQGDRN